MKHPNKERHDIEYKFINRLCDVEVINATPNGYWELSSESGDWFASYNVVNETVICHLRFDCELTTVDDTECVGSLLEECLERAGVNYEVM